MKKALIAVCMILSVSGLVHATAVTIDEPEEQYLGVYQAHSISNDGGETWQDSSKALCAIGRSKLILASNPTDPISYTWVRSSKDDGLPCNIICVTGDAIMMLAVSYAGKGCYRLKFCDGNGKESFRALCYKIRE